MLMLNKLIEERNLQEILKLAKEFHGHICPYLALGIRASVVAMDELGVGRLDYSSSIDERILAIVETNNCFSDGVQVATGCTFGNNSLIFLDLGKTALTLVKRGTWEGVRVYVDGEKIRSLIPREVSELFDKVVKRREGTEEDRKRLSKMWEKIGFEMLDLPKSFFKIERVEVEPIEQAPIFESVRCSKCGELVMSIRAVYINDEPFCLKCAGERYYALIGRGIVGTGGAKE
ncbi:formylmethanofuran dehydrogenase [Thermococcus sp. M39]|uniref:FmdE family protein n=1 Tax=unclassified Thermococcus TaxID=2627626 RepID=UPI0014387E9F|nr:MULTISPECIES: FmdE family protein [unclassified Thermococcus]NJE08520.1 formylmethanofuran dehydrogenase [Thermococcus sp. M39]NJE13118.1 formylmethanofuran dehydrogenase [Thermococcus sp. LS2]